VNVIDFLAAPSEPTAAEQLREGHNFSNQKQLGELLTHLQASPPHSDKLENSNRLLAAKLTAAVLDELQMFEHTDLLPDGGWWEQPAWRTELWQTYWQAQLSAQHWSQLQPLSDYVR